MAALILLLAVHFLSDFTLQPPWLATDKSSDLRRLSTHVNVHGFLSFGVLAFIIPWPHAVLAAVAIGASHAIIDVHAWQLLSNEKRPRYAFWVSLLLDQSLHLAVLGTVWFYFVHKGLF